MTRIAYSEKMLIMRVFLSALILIFGLQSWTKADDIRDFQIEGMSIGDSLLDFYQEDEINEKKIHIQTKGIYINQKIIML